MDNISLFMPQQFQTNCIIMFLHIYYSDIIKKNDEKMTYKAYFSKCDLISDVITWICSDKTLLFSL